MGEVRRSRGDYRWGKKILDTVLVSQWEVRRVKECGDTLSVPCGQSRWKLIGLSLEKSGRITSGGSAFFGRSRQTEVRDRRIEEWNRKGNKENQIRHSDYFSSGPGRARTKLGVPSSPM